MITAIINDKLVASRQQSRIKNTKLLSKSTKQKLKIKSFSISHLFISSYYKLASLIRG